jgi:acetylornithine deacetylase/succinyl-diaminopimelate desuccinylase-like protein
MANVPKQIDIFLEANLDHFIAELSELCAQTSISARSEGTRECAHLVRRILERHALSVQSFETAGNPVLVGRAAGRADRTLLCYNHYDVQPPEPLELWTTPPFQPTLRDGALYARGVADDKGELICRLAALEAVRAAHGGGLPCNVLFVVEGEEEIGSPTVAQFVLEHLDLLACDGSIWEGGGIGPDGAPDLTLGARGVLGVELSLQTMARDAHSGGAHVFPSAAWRLVRVLQSLKGPDEHILVPGWYDRVRPPSARDLALLDALPTFEDVYREVYGLTDFVLGRTGHALNRAVFEPTCNIEGITTGYHGLGGKTIIPSQASAKLDFRLVPDQEPDELLARLRAHLAGAGFADVTVTYRGAMRPSQVAPDSPFVQLTAETGQAVYGHRAQIVPIGGGSTPIYAFAGPLGGIPVVTAGVGYWDNRAHAPNEHMRLLDFLNGARHIARIIDGFAGLPPLKG